MATEEDRQEERDRLGNDPSQAPPAETLDEREETPQEREDEASAERRRLNEEQSEESAKSVDEQAPPTDDVDVSPRDDDELEEK